MVFLSDSHYLYIYLFSEGSRCLLGILFYICSLHSCGIGPLTSPGLSSLHIIKYWMLRWRWRFPQREMIKRSHKGHIKNNTGTVPAGLLAGVVQKVIVSVKPFSRLPGTFVLVILFIYLLSSVSVKSIESRKCCSAAFFSKAVISPTARRNYSTKCLLEINQCSVDKSRTLYSSIAIFHASLFPNPSLKYTVIRFFRFFFFWYNSPLDFKVYHFPFALTLTHQARALNL